MKIITLLSAIWATIASIVYAKRLGLPQRRTLNREEMNKDVDIQGIQDRELW